MSRSIDTQPVAARRKDPRVSTPKLREYIRQQVERTEGIIALMEEEGISNEHVRAWMRGYNEAMAAILRFAGETER